MSHKMLFVVKDVKPEDTKTYDGTYYEVKAHCKSCFFCDHCKDIFWDYTHGPYLFLCDEKFGDNDAIRKGFIGKCKSFKEGDK